MDESVVTERELFMVAKIFPKRTFLIFSVRYLGNSLALSKQLLYDWQEEMDVAFVKALIAWKEKKEVIYGCRAVRANLRKNLLIHLDCISEKEGWFEKEKYSFLYRGSQCKDSYLEEKR